MKTSKYIFLSMAAVVLAVACKEELNPDNPIKANPGDEVQFGAALPGKTKTVYGEEIANEDGTNPRFPIYWVNGDKVRVASPQCSASHNSAEYQVAVDSEKQNYATSLTKTGDAGVQWGDNETADFYSIYPATASTKLEISGESVSTTLHVDATQFASTKDLGTSYYAQPAEMGNVVMYAKRAGVNRNDPDTKGVVELHYTPFSTVLEFELTAPDNQGSGKTNSIIVQSLSLTAPEGTNIAGDFDFNFDGPTITPDAVSGSNVITMHFLKDNQYNITLTPDVKTMKAKMCLMPISNVKSLLDWKVEVNTSAGTFIKTLKESDFANEDGSTKNTALAPGKVHKIKLPKLNYASEEWKYDLANWIPSLPDYRNIYLSEISLPGAWYAGATEDYQASEAQGTNGIAFLWNNGVRAFGVETRTESTNTVLAWEISSHGVPENVVVSGTGKNSSFSYETGTNSLNSSPGDKSHIYYGGTNIEDIIGTIADKVAQTQEFAVLVLSYSDAGPTKGGTRYIDYGAWLNMLKVAYERLTPARKAAIYQGPIDANTTVDKVVGKLIIKINVDANIAKERYFRGTTYAYEGTLPALFSYNPFLFQMKSADYTRPYYSSLSWKTWGDGSEYRSYDLVANLQSQDAASNADKFIWVFSSANRTQVDTGTDNTIPTYAQRQKALGAMGDYSKTIYDASTHNVWFYFNCGGTQAESSTSDSNLSPTAFATIMNKWLLERINAKTDASPLGIVMFNQCTSDTYKGPAIVKAIIEMNSKFYLKHAGTSGGSTGGTEDATAPNDATVQDGGNAI